MDVMDFEEFSAQLQAGVDTYLRLIQDAFKAHVGSKEMPRVDMLAQVISLSMLLEYANSTMSPELQSLVARLAHQYREAAEAAEPRAPEVQ